MSYNTPKQGFANNVLKLVSGTTAAQFITVLTAPVISRLFLPDAFGTLAVFVSLVSILSIIVCLRYEYAIMLPEGEDEAINVLALSLLIAFIFSLVVGGVIFLTRQAILGWLNAPDLAPYLWLVPVAVFIQGLFQSFNYWNSRTRSFGRVSVARVAASLTTSAIPISLGLLRNTSTTVLIGSWLAGTLVLTSLLGWGVWKQSFARLYNKLSPGKIQNSLVRYRKFPLIDAWGGFINNLSWQIPSLVLSAYFTQTVVGYYSQAHRIVLLPSTLVGGAIAQVFYQRASELRSDRQKLTATVGLVFQALVFIGLAPALVLTIVGKELFILFLGPNWSEAGLYAQILGFWIFFLLISSPLSTLFMVLERQELALVVNIIILLTRLAALFFGSMLHNIYLTLWIWSISGVIVYGILSAWILHLAGISLLAALKQIGMYIGYFTPVGLFIGILRVISVRYPASPVSHELFIVVCVAIGILLTYLYTLRHDRILADYLIQLAPPAWQARLSRWLISAQTLDDRHA